MGQAGVIADLHGDLLGMPLGQAAHRLFKRRITAAQAGKLKHRPAVELLLKRAKQNVDPLLVGEPADVAEQRRVVEQRQAELVLQRPLVGGLTTGRVGGVGGCEVRVVHRVPFSVVDAVEHAAQRVVPGLEHALEAAAVFPRQQFARVARAHGGDEVGGHDTALEEVHVAVKLKLPRVEVRVGQPGQRELVGGEAALVGGVVDGENLADWFVRE